MNGLIQVGKVEQSIFGDSLYKDLKLPSDREDEGSLTEFLGSAFR